MLFTCPLMRILHVGFGYRPWIVNGLVIYGETVMDAQASRGHDVGYFFPARQLPGVHRTFVHRWRRRGVQMFELVNSSLVVGRHDGTADPLGELEHPPTEIAFRSALNRFRPELVHVHDLGGLPSSIIDIAGQRGVPVVMTIHDYQALCPTVKLYDAYDRVCLRDDPGEMCTVCCAGAPHDNGEELARTLALARRTVRSAIPPLDAALRRPEAERLGVAAIRLMERVTGAATADGTGPGTDGTHGRTETAAAPAFDYQRRRDVNVERLNRLTALIASSQRSADIFRQLGVAVPPAYVISVNPPHIAQLTPKRRAEPGDPLRFVALNACNTVQKGARLIVEALSRLSARGLDDRFRLAVHGSVGTEFRASLAAHPSVQIRGDYRVEDLDRLLEDGDVGLFPSVWEEVYGFVGLEFLAKGIPVIGNAIGAIPEYVWPGETGWLNRSLSSDELADLMQAAIADPAEAQRLGARAVELRSELIQPFDAAFAELMGLYEQLVTDSARHRPGI